MNQSRQPTRGLVAWLARFRPRSKLAVYARTAAAVCSPALPEAVRRSLMFVCVHLDRHQVDHSSRFVATDHDVWQLNIHHTIFATRIANQKSSCGKETPSIHQQL